ncbi:MAG: hypothetical protein E6I91_06535 [Chloroflexi bacterium]|nr:MAG: hypothetical protein E6I91_06535 [Chloroflexota bacterium]
MSDTFNPNQHLLQLKSRDGVKDYLPVQWRLVWFRQECPQGTIETEELEYDTEKECSIETFVWNGEKRRSEKVVKNAKGYARYRAVVTDGKGGRATGTKAECRANFEDYGEKAETGAIGRALAGLGYGTQFAPELDEEHRIVDSPVERGSASPVESNDNNNGRKALATVRPAAARNSGTANGDGHSAASAAAETAPDGAATEQQLSSIRKLCEHLGKPEPEHIESMSFASAKELIGQLSQEYRQSRSKAS